MQLQIIILSEVNQKDKDKYYMSILKSRDITFLKKVCIVKAMVFPVVMYGCESWTVKKVEHEIIVEKTLESPLDSKEIKPVNPKGNQL